MYRLASTLYRARLELLIPESVCSQLLALTPFSNLLTESGPRQKRVQFRGAQHQGAHAVKDDLCEPLVQFSQNPAQEHLS